LARSAPGLYERHVFYDGSEARQLNVPSDALKEVQSAIYERILRQLPVNPCVHSAPGRSILSNARRHVGHQYLSTFDIRHCFPAIGPRRVRAALERAGFNSAVAKLLTRLTTVGHQLPQGAPTSPALLNAVLVDLDGKIASVARAAGLSYSRYVDDLFLSGGARTPSLAQVVERIIRNHQLELHPKKRFDWGPTERHTVTAIMVNTTPSALPEYVESLIVLIEQHRCSSMILTPTNVASIRGKIGFVDWVNPTQGAELERMLRDVERGAAIPA
jgi:hypothetical protein